MHGNHHRNVLYWIQSSEEGKVMQTTRIHFEDTSFIDIRVSDIQTEEFRRWLRFANRNDTYSVPGLKRVIRRRDIARTEFIPDED